MREVSKQKLSDRTFLKLITVYILGIIISAVGLASTTWTWYTATKSSADNYISGATLDFDITVVDGEGNTVSPVASDSKAYTLYPGSYTFSFVKNGTASSGYVMIYDLSTAPQRYYSAVMTEEVPSLTLKITVDSQSPITVKVASKWGYHSESSVNDGETLNFTFN